MAEADVAQTFHRFLDLPLELRCMIYKEVFDRPSHHLQPEYLRNRTRRPVNRPNYFAILQVSHQVHAEANPLKFHNLHELYLDHRQHKTIHLECMQGITMLTLDFDSVCFEPFTRSDYTGLQQVVLCCDHELVATCLGNGQQEDVTGIFTNCHADFTKTSVLHCVEKLLFIVSRFATHNLNDVSSRFGDARVLLDFNVWNGLGTMRVSNYSLNFDWLTDRSSAFRT